MEIRTDISELNGIITDTGLITDYGGWCINRTDKPLPYGINPALTNCENHPYTYDENCQAVGYLYIKNVVSTGIKNQIRVTIAINIFTTPKKIGSSIPTYEIPLALFGHLWKNKKYKNAIRISNTIDAKYSFQDMSTIEIDIDYYADCAIPEFLAEIC